MADEEFFEILGVSVSAAPFAAVLDRVLRAPDEGDRLSLHFATAHTMVEAHDNDELLDALRSGLVQPDGMPLVWFGRRLGLRVERVCGPDFMLALIEQGISYGRTHYFYGGAAGVPETIAERLSARYPGIRVAGTESPPFRTLTPEEDLRLTAKINEARPDYVWIGLGTPKQDIWTARHRPLLGASAILAVGAAFDLYAGVRRRAPRTMQRTGTEWLYRLAAEPRRLAGRYTVTNIRFLSLLVSQRLAHRPRRD